MTDKPQPPWQPLSRLPLFTTMIDEAVAEAQTMLGDVQTGVGLNGPKLHIWTSAGTNGVLWRG